LQAPLPGALTLRPRWLALHSARLVCFMVRNDSRSVSRFGVFELDHRSGELRKSGVRVRLRTQSLQVLTLLLDRAGDVVTREELQRHIWATDTFVDFERGLNKAVNRLRDVLGDTASSPRYIETLPKRGYRFIVPVEHPAVAPATSSPEVAAAQPARKVSAASRTTPPGLVRWLVAGGLALIAVTAATSAWIARRSPTATEPVTVVLADFDNTTGDAAFDHVLQQALIINLGQSPAIRIPGEHELRRTLRLMASPANARLTRELARDVCRRISGQAVLSGSLAALGREYVLGLDALDCQTGEPIGHRQVRVSRQEGLLAAIDGATADIRGKLGESRDSLQRFDTRVHDMLTTGSLDAFAAYTSGERNVFTQGGWSTVPFFQHAIELDPQFAYAHAALGLVLGTMGETVRSRTHTEQAYALRDRVSEWERFFITAQYHDRVTGELDKVLSACDLWIQAYPQERTAHNRLAAVYNQLGQPARALAELEQARRIGRDHPIDIDVWVQTATRLNREREALSVIRPLLEQTPDRVPLRRTAYRLSVVAGDTNDMAAHLEWARQTPRAEALLAEASETDASSGRVDQSRRWLTQAVAAAVRNDFTGNAGIWTGVDAVRQALFGHRNEARAQARAAVDFEHSTDTRALAAVALARIGDIERARQLADQLHAEQPRGTLVQNYWIPVIRAEGAVHANNPSRAIEWLRTAEPYELSDTRLPLLPAFVRGEAYLSARDGDRAAVEFQKLLDHRGAVANSVLGALARLGVARAQALAGHIAKARTSYDSFFELWRDADPGLPVLRQARLEYQAIAPRAEAGLTEASSRLR
jgi:eukaryotic-like serine/threonine-protein kinase